MRKVESGRCCLFCKGVLQLSWKEVNGKMIDKFTLYEQGRVLDQEKWSSLWNTSVHRWIENTKDGLVLGVEENGVVYRGEMIVWNR